MLDGQGSPVQSTHGGCLFSRVLDVSGGEFLFYLKNGIDALGGNVMRLLRYVPYKEGDKEQPIELFVSR